MNSVLFESGQWTAVCLPEDGARVSVLRHGTLDLLTSEPTDFRPPEGDYGKYETRPVYGYDDCFPTVDACEFPGDAQCELPDHGELCRLDWEVETSVHSLTAQTRSRVLPIIFRRTMVFAERSLNWQFELINESQRPLPYLHVMHALLPLDRITDVQLPEFEELFDEMADKLLPAQSSPDVAAGLLATPPGTARMLLLRGARNHSFALTFQTGECLTVTYPDERFSTLGIWWNNGGYPDEDGCRRVECAFEPIAGAFSSLARSHAEGLCAWVPGGERQAWSITWNVQRIGKA